MTNSELLKKVKDGLGITGDYQDATLQIYIDDVKGTMLDAGVLPEVIKHKVSTGCIVRGVSDIWNYGSGTVKLSEHFNKRVIQLSKYKVTDLEKLSLLEDDT